MTINPTVGIEVEFYNLGPNALRDLDFGIPSNNHDDGSVRDTTYKIVDIDGTEQSIFPNFVKGRPIMASGLYQDRNYGLEWVSAPVNYEDLKNPLRHMSELLVTVPQTPRTSIHVHVDIANVPWRKIQNLLNWVYRLEAVLFRLSCGGMKHRGERFYRDKNDGGEATYTDYRFCRPLSDPIGCYWVSREQIGKKVSPLVLINKMLNANSASEFLAYWGRLDLYAEEQRLPHYCGHRLHMINLASIFRYGTIEWRLFDAIYGKIDKIVDLVIAMHELAYSGASPDFSPMILGFNYDMDIYEVNRLLNIDVSSLWGKRWPAGTKTKNRKPHYGDIAVHKIEETPIVKLLHDDGSDNVPLFMRRNY